MREWGRVFANEWMKLIHRRQFWIIMLLAVLMSIGLSGTMYQWEKEYAPGNLIVDMKQRIERYEQNLREMKKESLKGTSEGASSSDLQKEIKMVEKSIERLKGKLHRMQQLKSPDWDQLIKSDLAKLQQRMEKYQGDSEAGRESQRQKGYAQQTEWQYLLERDIPPLLQGEFTAWKAMNQLMPLASGLFLPMLLVILVADMVSGETASGTMKLLLVRPVSRVKILLGKWAASLTATMVLSLCFFATMLAVHLLLYSSDGARQPHFVNVDFLFGMGKEGQIVPIPLFDKALLIPEWQYIAGSMLLSVFAMMAVASITFLCSTVFKSPLISSGAALAMVILGQALQQEVHNGKWMFWLFTVHLNPGSNWDGQLSNTMEANLPLTTGITVLTIWIGVTLLASLLYFRKKDILNA
ncbi:ABC transporter permease subunit [Salinithrix halophila]|uniref:ABC transporter permease subunit n=1 Tax=Salinithrix halophila TaxID=1485204 RepID=A0ABV8JFC7_9BACL